MSKRFFFLLLLAGACAPAAAEWVKIAHSGQSVFYLDASVSKKVGGHIMIWVLRDHGGLRFGPTGGYLSSKDQLEVDCPGRRIRRIYSADFPQPMGQGKQVSYEHGPMSWNLVTPNTIISRLVDVACLRP